MPVVASFGDVNIDLLASVDRHPPRGQESFAQDASIGLGGSATNTAVVLCRLGIDSRILAQLGEDDFAAQAVSRLGEAGVDTSFLARSPQYTTGINIVLVDPEGERTMVGLRGSNRSYRGSRGWERGADWLHMSGYALLEEPQATAARTALDTARAAAIPVSFDIPSGVAATIGAALVDHLRGAAVVALGAASLGEIFPGGDPVGRVPDLESGLVAVTDGGRPFTIYRPGESLTLEPPSTEVVDTTGAGDSFAAGLIAATLRGCTLGGTAVLSAALGAAAVEVDGAGDHLADPERLEKILTARPWNGADPNWITEAAAAVGL